MRRVALLEKTRTPYRHPLFEYVGQHVDLSVFYAGDAGSHRRWDVTASGSNYTARDLKRVSAGPFVVLPELFRELRDGGYDEIVVSTTMSMALNSYVARYLCARTDIDLTIWTEKIDTEWRDQRFTPSLHSPEGVARGLSLPSRAGRNVFTHSLDEIHASLYREADSVIAFSRLAEQAALSQGATGDSLTTVPQWYPPSALPDPDREISSPDTFRVLFVGTLEMRKGVDVLLDVARRYDRSDGIDFVIAGSGPLEESVSEAAANNLHISAPGYVAEERKMAEYTAADLFVLPSRHDPWGLVVNEARIAGTPSVVTDACGSRMIVPDECVVAPDDPDELYRAIESAREGMTDAPSLPTLERMAEPLIRGPGSEKHVTEVN